jgi:glutathione S-transferase
MAAAPSGECGTYFICTMEGGVIKLCGFSVSNYYNKVKLALLEKGIPFQESLIYPAGNTAILADSPMGKVPYILVDGIAISESQPILEYLEQTCPDTPLFPSDPARAAKCRELIQVIELYLELPARRLYGEAFFGGRVSEETKNEVSAVLTKAARAGKTRALPAVHRRSRFQFRGLRGLRAPAGGVERIAGGAGRRRARPGYRNCRVHEVHRRAPARATGQCGTQGVTGVVCRIARACLTGHRTGHAQVACAGFRRLQSGGSAVTISRYEYCNATSQLCRNLNTCPEYAEFPQQSSSPAKPRGERL